MDAKTWEVAVLDVHGAWDLFGEFPSRESAIEVIRAAVKTGMQHELHHDDDGRVVFGLSGDPASGHYEDRVIARRHDDGTYDLIES